ncbi:efflux RND transporter periplasmic adaptor subunit [Polaribacter undariae]|uniref:Efflux RND transporter periplasmic adaptor subunit n=1 Tax=Polaribacter sejongensis TaxID=985043 RepID=A0AAJ1QXH5_9FLAO|nr:efflux RND transporter periplasmic adaptor subunit [Polaribacter undariae]MDN3619411.1 efflux RND transporter periplasmic adaptor subunit [Polaribacter undariae]UWD33389.1 efflux RND transporter periplasmic adaptor subunit [Polaribacter undariae]
MKKYINYIAILAVGLLLGWVLFGGNSNTEEMHKHDAVAETNQMWTCSMHPQIMQPEAGDCPICGMDLIPAASSAEGLSADQFKLSENAMALANIQTSIVGEHISDADTGFVLSGKITENEDETATMPAHFNGRVEKLFVNSLGERVAKGQAVAQIYSPELIAAQQELITAYKLKGSQPQLYNAVKNKFKNWMIHGPQLNEVEQTGKVKNSFTIYSHVSGVVTEISINVGSHIMDGKPIFKVSNLNTVWANFDVYENQISQFKKGQDVEVTTNAYPNKAFKGKVNFIDPILDTQTRTVNLRVVLNNKNELFKPGMFVEGKMKGIVSVDKKQVITIPASAVLWTGKRSVVYVKTNPKEPIFEMREITLGNQVNSNYQVLEGLNNGNEIVTNGTFTVDAAAQLQGKKSMMNKGGGKVMTGHEGHLGMEMSGSVEVKTISKNERIKVSKEFQNQLKVVFNDYIGLKDALVLENSTEVLTVSKSLLSNLEKVDMKQLKAAEAHKHWMDIEKQLKTATTLILENTAIKEQRNHFKIVSTQLTNAIEVFGINEKVYHQFCPMANSNKGAYWLSREEKVVNPYFGDAMLTCGEVKQVIN